MRWTLRRGDVSAGVTLVVTGHLARIDQLATKLAAANIYTFAAVVDAVPQLWNVASFDVVVVLPDVAAADRAIIAKLTPPVGDRLLIVSPDQEPELVALVTSRLSKH